MLKPPKTSPILDLVYHAYNKNDGKMLVHTGTIGWILSSAAQIFGITMNDKISKEQKMFLIPQEFSDAVFNILSFYLVTNSLTKIVDKLIDTGKWIPKKLKRYLIKQNYEQQLGKFTFDITKIPLPSSQKADFIFFKVGMGVAAMTIGSIISCNIITPLFRNLYASKRQKANIEKLNNPNPAWQNPKTPREIARAKIHNTYMQAFMNNGNLKV